MKRYHCHKKMYKKDTGYNAWKDFVEVYVCRVCGLYCQYSNDPSCHEEDK